jgi:hypothetical protein
VARPHAHAPVHQTGRPLTLSARGRPPSLVAAQYADPQQQADWEANGRPAAAARIEAASARTLEGQ